MLIHGHVIDKNLQGVPEVIVSHARRGDPDKIKDLDEEKDVFFQSTTDKSGYYFFVANTRAVENVLKNKMTLEVYSIDYKMIHREPEIKVSAPKTLHEIVLSDEKVLHCDILKPTKKTKSKKPKR
ncbi:MAG: hypothetical protein HRO68_06125 [Nitrosopumilus sp.]|nr:hypothetical protein [Nitrosopumilus sp.]